jgi:hypothetical protein
VVVVVELVHWSSLVDKHKRQGKEEDPFDEMIFGRKLKEASRWEYTRIQ